MIIRILSIAMIVLGIIGLVVTGVVFNAAGQQVDNIGATLNVADQTLADVSDALATSSQSINVLLKDLDRATTAVSGGIATIQTYLTDTGENIGLVNDQLGLSGTTQNIAAIKNYLRNMQLPLNAETLADLREQVASSELMLTSSEVTEFKDFLTSQSSLTPSDVMAKLEQYTGYYALPDVEGVIDELNSVGIQFIQNDGWLQISGSDMAEAADILERNTGLDMSYMRVSGTQMASLDLAGGLSVAQPLSNTGDSLLFWESQKSALVESIKVLEEDTKFVSQQIPVVAKNLSKAEEALITADQSIAATGQTMLDLGEQFKIFNDSFGILSKNISQLAVAENLTTLSDDLKAMKISEARNLLSTLLKGLATLMTIGSILFVLAGIALLLMDLRFNGNKLRIGALPSASA